MEDEAKLKPCPDSRCKGQAYAKEIVANGWKIGCSSQDCHDVVFAESLGAAIVAWNEIEREEDRVRKACIRCVREALDRDADFREGESVADVVERIVDEVLNGK